MRLPFCTVDVFTDTPFGGNPLAVFPEAESLDGETMQRIAAELNLSETTFVAPPADADHACSVRIFTPRAELPFAGHPTLGTAFALAELGKIALDGEHTHVVLEEGVGPVPVRLAARQGRPVGAQLTAALAPERGSEAPSAEQLARALCLRSQDLHPSLSAERWSAGVEFLYVPLASRAAVAAAGIRHDAWAELGEVANVFLFSEGGEAAGIDWHARMFAPQLGVPEDPATGSAAAAFAGYLGSRADTPAASLACTIEQGIEMGRPSLLEVEAEVRDGRTEVARVAGACVMMSEGVFRVP